MKKLLNAIVSMVVGASMYLLGLIPCFTATDTVLVASSSKNYSFYDMLSSEVDVVTAYKIFAIIMMIVAGLLILGGVVELLKQLSVLKVKFNVGGLNFILAVLLVVSLIGLTISAFVVANSGNASLGALASSSLTVSAGIYILDVIGIAGLVLTFLTSNIKLKK